MRPPSLRWPWRAVSLAGVVLSVGLVLATSPTATSAPGSLAKVDARVLGAVRLRGSGVYWVLLRQHADLAAAPSIRDWDARGAFVVDRLKSAARQSQRGVLAVLRGRGASFEQFWIVDAIRVVSNLATLEAVAARPEVGLVVPDRSARNPDERPAAAASGVNGVEWNIGDIEANQVWKKFGDRGQGVVVANIDTGVQYDHPALVRQYRGNKGGGQFDHNYNWFDPASICPNKTPCDNAAHGTHTMGIAVGDGGPNNKIGVAPKAQWIAAKGCENNPCSFSSLLASGQWMLAPTDLNNKNPRPDLRPDVVSNSWAPMGDDTFYQSTVKAWVASGIFPVFSAGSGGPACSTVGAPASYRQSYGVGAYDMDHRIASFSSRGPGPLGSFVKPNVAGPGVNIRSSIPPNAYSAYSGTSMATPHVAGTVALVWSAAPSYRGDIARTRKVLNSTAIDTSDLSCGGTPGNNMVWGHGRLDALLAVEKAMGKGSR